MSKAASFSVLNFSPARLAALLLCGALAGCANVETLAPPVAVLKGEHSSLEAGRRIYLGECTACHSAEPIRDYAAARWPGILTDMARKTKLTTSQERDVRAYVAAVCRASES